MVDEIERQFLINELPSDLEQHPRVQIRQGYLAVTQDREVRIREVDGNFTLTVKTGQGLVRKETEITISQLQFDELWTVTGPQRIEKHRYFYPYLDYVLHIDIYQGSLAGFNVVEIEFSNKQQSEAFPVPEFFGEEVTDQGSFYYLQKLLTDKPSSQ